MRYMQGVTLEATFHLFIGLFDGIYNMNDHELADLKDIYLILKEE
jgi:hypothetical protein